MGCFSQRKNTILFILLILATIPFLQVAFHFDTQPPALLNQLAQASETIKKPNTITTHNRKASSSNSSSSSNLSSNTTTDIEANIHSISRSALKPTERTDQHQLRSFEGQPRAQELSHVPAKEEPGTLGMSLPPLNSPSPSPFMDLPEEASGQRQPGFLFVRNMAASPFMDLPSWIILPT